MPKKGNKIYKRITALVMCLILAATSLPIALAAGETAYNPAPYFTDDAQKQGAAAWMDVDGNLQVRFPEATGRPRYADWKTTHDSTQNPKSVAYYIVELSNIGAKLEKHKANPDILLTKKIEIEAGIEGLAAVDLLTAVFTETELATLGTAFDLNTNRYNISITAVDSEGWFSLPLDALVSQVPEFNYDMTGFELLTEHGTAMREMMRFEAEGSYANTVQTGDSVSQLVWNGYNGAEDPTSGVASNGFRVLVDSAPGIDGQSVDTPVSRQTWDFTDASEVWYWLDLTDVELEGLSFRLRANYKWINYQQRNASMSSNANDADQTHSPIVYSTVGTTKSAYTGESPYVMVQQENGTWKKIMMQGGTVDLGHMKGYVRIPIQFFCSETDATVETNNTWAGSKKDMGSAPGRDNTFQSDYSLSTSFVWNTSTNMPDYDTHVVVDPAGTPISEALLIQRGRLYYRAALSASDKYSYNLGSFIAPGVSSDDITSSDNTNRAYMVKDASAPQGWRVENRGNGYKALDDIYSAGLAYQSVTEDSLHHSFFFDNVMFLRNDNGAWDPATIGGNTTTGNPINDYFNQKTYAQDQVLKAIDAYIGEPSWTDYRGVHYVENMMEVLAQAFADAGASYANDFMTDAELEARAAATDKAYIWENYKEAVQLCKDFGTYETNNSKPDELVPSIVQLLDTLPDPENMTNVSDDDIKLLIRLYQSYMALNYGQLKMLGSYVDPVTGKKFEEEKLLAYIAFLGEELNQSFLTGYKIANYPFIPFNTFEENTTIGEKAYRVEDGPAWGTMDYRHTKGLSAYATNNWSDFTTGGASMNTAMKGNINSRPHSGDTAITENGYNGSKGLTSTITSKWLDGVETYYCVLMSKNSKSADTFENFKTNNMSAENLGGLALDNDDALSDTTASKIPFSLVMYVDFTEFKDSDPDFYFVPTIHTVKSGNTDVYARPRLGNETGWGDQEWWHYYYILDNATGEWQRVYNGTGANNLYRFCSTQSSVSGAEGVNLRGYKGYIAIPMQHFKLTNTGGNLSEDSTALNNIYSIQFSISGGNTCGKSFTIDNIGFTYDPSFYTSKGVVTATRGDKSYAEVFKAKSNKAEEFENKVASINPYDTPENLTTLVAEADAIYSDLGEFQRTGVKSVIASKERLELLRTYANGTASPEPIVNDLAWLKNKINNEWNTIPDVSALLLPNPGFTYPDGATPLASSEVNYAAFGLTAAMAQEIIDGYEKTAERLTPADATLTAEEIKILENAYTAAVRCNITLETTGSQAQGFAEALQSIYTIYTDEDYNGLTHRLFQAADTSLDGVGTSRGDIVAFTENMYDPLPYYAKTELSNGNIIKAYANMTDGIARYLANTKTVTIVKADGASETVQAGVWKLAEQYTALYDELKPKLDNKELLDAALLTRVREAIAEYNDLIPAYKNIFELYYGSEQLSDGGTYKGVKDIMDLFVRAEASFADTGTAETTLDLDSTTVNTKSATLNLTYLEALDADSGAATGAYFTVDYDGNLSPSEGINLAYELYLNGTKVDATAAGGTAPQFLAGELLNNVYTASAPKALNFTIKVTGTPSFLAQAKDTVTVKLCRPADAARGETTAVELGTYILNIQYLPDESFSVQIPADIDIPWGTETPQGDPYKVTSALREDHLKVTVTDENAATRGGNILLSDSADQIVYTPHNIGTSEEFDSITANAVPAVTPQVSVAADEWAGKPLGNYQTTLTYTVEKVAGKQETP